MYLKIIVLTVPWGGLPERICADSIHLSYIHHGWMRRLDPSAHAQPVLSRGCRQSWTSADEGGIPCDSETMGIFDGGCSWWNGIATMTTETGVLRLVAYEYYLLIRLLQAYMYTCVDVCTYIYIYYMLFIRKIMFIYIYIYVYCRVCFLWQNTCYMQYMLYKHIVYHT